MLHQGSLRLSCKTEMCLFTDQNTLTLPVKQNKLLFLFTGGIYPRCQGPDVSFTIQWLPNLTQTVCWNCSCHFTQKTTVKQESYNCFVLKDGYRGKFH